MNTALRCKIWRVATLKCKRGCDDNIKTDRRKVVSDVVGFNHLADSCEHGQEHSEARKTN